MAAEIAELDELAIAQLSSKIEREVALAQDDVGSTQAGPPRGLSIISSGAQLSDMVGDSLEVAGPEPEPETCR